MQPQVEREVFYKHVAKHQRRKTQTGDMFSAAASMAAEGGGCTNYSLPRQTASSRCSQCDLAGNLEDYLPAEKEGEEEEDSDSDAEQVQPYRCLPSRPIALVPVFHTLV